MPLNKRNTRAVHRTAFAGETETVTLLKRGDDQQQGVVTSYKLFRCRIGMIGRGGQTIQGAMDSQHAATWHIPRTELDRVGVHYLSALDRIVRNGGETWQVEDTTTIDVKLFRNEIDLNCLLVEAAENEES